MERISTGTLHTSYRFGELIFTSLCDGYVDMPTSRLRQPGDRQFGEALPEGLHLTNGQLRLSVNVFAIDDGRTVTLFDTGASNAWHPTMGKLPEALAEAQIAANRVKTVVFTHTHIDHINGLVLPNGENAFPALSRLMVPRAELGMFRSEERLKRFHDLSEPFEGGDGLASNIEVIAAPGHEVGHSCFRVTSGEKSVLVWGDTVHVPSLQFQHPEITWEFDADQDQARQSRMRLFELASRERIYVAGAHLDFPGVGQLRREGSGFALEQL